MWDPFAKFSVTTRTLSTDKHGPARLVSERSRTIHHLEVEHPFLLRKSTAERPAASTPHRDGIENAFFHSLAVLFPVLKALNVQVDNTGAEAVDVRRRFGRFYMVESNVLVYQHRVPRF